MARFLQPPTQKLVDMTPASQADFYEKVLASAQNNLERSVAARQEAVQYYNSLPFHTKEDYDAVIGEAQKGLSEVVDGDFPAPARIANKVMELNQKLQPGINALKRKDEQVKIEQQGRLKLGINYLGNDVSNMPIKSIDGNFVDPNTLTSKYYDADQIRKGFMESEGANLSAVRELGLQRGEYGYLKSVTSTGLDTPEKVRKYGIDSPNAQLLAEKKLAEMPEDFVQIMGGRDKALATIKQLHWEAANNPDFAYKLQQQYLQPIKTDEPRTVTKTGTKTTSLFDGFISRDYVAEPNEDILIEDYNKRKDEAKLSIRGEKGSTTGLKDYTDLRKKYPSILDKVIRQVAETTKGKNLSSQQTSSMIAGIFYDMVANKEINESKVIQTAAEASPTQSGSFYSFLNNVPDNYKFTDSEEKSYTKSELSNEKTLLSDNISGSPVKMPLVEDYVEVYHKKLGKNLKVPIDALDISVKNANTFIKTAYNVFNSNKSSGEPIPYPIPQAWEEFDDGSRIPAYFAVYRENDKSYLAMGKYVNNKFEIDPSTSQPLENSWGTLSALKVQAFTNAYSK